MNITLNTGANIPQFGLGTYKMSNEDATRVIPYAIELGYRHIDTAQMYGNEAAVGAAIKASGINRADIFLTTKLDNPNHEPARALESFDESLQRLGTDYVDLFLIHWPLPQQYGGDFLSTWHALEEIAASGRAKAIGVSNFQPHHIDVLLEGSHTVPAINQIEVHPYFHNTDVVEHCRAHGIAIEAWAPLVRGAVTSEPAIASIAERHGCTPAQAVLAWHLAQGNIIFPKSVTPARIKENWDAQQLELTPEELALIGGLDRGKDGRTGYNPDTMTRSHPLAQ